MNRSDFLKIIGATPFAIKSLMMGRDVEEVAKKVNPKSVKGIKENCFLFKVDGKEFGVSRVGSINMHTDIESVSYSFGDQPMRLTIEVEFDQLVIDDKFDVLELFNNRETITVEYYKGIDGSFYHGDGYFVDLSRDMNFYSGTVRMNQLEVQA